jgi:hypothetical protein
MCPILKFDEACLQPKCFAEISDFAGRFFAAQIFFSLAQAKNKHNNLLKNKC